MATPDRPTAPKSGASPRITVIVLNYNGKEHLEGCLASLAAQDIREPFATLVWDNASADGSVAFLRERFPWVQAEACPENLGFAKAMNRAIRASSSPYCVLLNNDTRAEPDWLRRLVQAADAAPPDVAALGSRMLLFGPGRIVNHAGAKFAPIGGGFDEGFGQPESAFAGRPDVYETGAPCGGAALFRRDIYLRLGGFDDTFFLYTEDADFGMRAWLAGYRILHAAKAVVWHRFGGTVGDREAPFRVYWGQRNRVRMLYKTCPGRRLPLALLGLLAWSGGMVLHLLLRGRLRAGGKALQGTAAGLLELGRYGAARQEVQRHLRRPEAELRAAGLMVSAKTLLGMSFSALLRGKGSRPEAP